MFNVQNLKNHFPILSNDSSLTYFDNASTTHKPKVVIDKITEFYSCYNANVHRGTYDIAEKATKEYENSRLTVSKFISCKPEEIIFTKNTTESINLIANSLSENILNENDEIIISEMEHHSNIIPWQLVAQKKKLNLQYIPIGQNGELNLDSFKSLINKKTKLISITHMSNLLGTINPIEKIISIAKENNILTMIDAAQSISHKKINIEKINCDFLVFSGHKILGPTGVGILFGKEDILKKMPPFLGGGHMIKEVTMEKSTWGDIPYKFEAGTPNIAPVIGLNQAIKFFKKMKNKDSDLHLKKLSSYFFSELKKIKDITIISPEGSPIIAFNILGIHSFDLTKLLSTYNICIRSGHHCAQPILNKYHIDSINRVSLYYYNTKEEIDFFFKKLTEIINILK